MSNFLNENKFGLIYYLVLKFRFNIQFSILVFYLNLILEFSFNVYVGIKISQFDT